MLISARAPARGIGAGNRTRFRAGICRDEAVNTRKPRTGFAVRQTWRRILFLHWEVPQEAIAKALPPGVQVDTFSGKAYVSIVAFTMAGARQRLLPFAPWVFRFGEVDMRTYVRIHDKPAVWLFSVDAANFFACSIARRRYGLPYFCAKVKIGVSRDGRCGTVVARRRRGTARFHVRYHLPEAMAPAQPGTLEHFLLERRCALTQREGRLLMLKVQHQPYRVGTAPIAEVHQTLLEERGIVPVEDKPLAQACYGIEVFWEGMAYVR